MPRITEHFIDLVRDAADIVGIIGRCDVADDKFELSKYQDGGIEKGLDDDWIDPRKGDLFYIIDLLLQKAE